MQEPCDFEFYSDYYAYIAQSGMHAAQALFRAISPIQQIDMLTFDIFTDAQVARDDLDFGIRTAYETVFSNMYSVNSMEAAFTSLARHIRQTEGYESVNAFIEAFGIQVLPAYASLSNVFGETIETGNIRDYGDDLTCGQPEPPEPPEPLVAVPWVEQNNLDPDKIQNVVDGLLVWQRSTDTAIVSTTPGKAELFTTLRAQTPGMHIIPGMKIHDRVGDTGIDVVANWELVAADVAEIIATSGETRLVLECESAMNAYEEETYDINMATLIEGIQLLPSGIEYWWYTIVAPDHARGRALLEAVQEGFGTSVTFVDLDISSPWNVVPGFASQRAARRAAYDAVALNPPLPIVYFFSDNWLYWDEDEILEAMSYTDARPIIPYTGSTHWVARAITLTNMLNYGTPTPP